MQSTTSKKFIKMHGLGNDFVIFDQRRGEEYDFSAVEIKNLADRHYGIGCDQFIILRQSTVADIQMLIFNADGSAAGACGNATRCVGLLSGLDKTSIAIAGRLINAERLEGNKVRVNMGKAIFESAALSVNLDINREAIAVNMGNPHLVIFLPFAPEAFAKKYGAQLEHHANFPDGVNVNFAQVIDNSNIVLSVWERGAGLTLACGSGACATYAAARYLKMVDKEVNIHLPGGILKLSNNVQGDVLMSGAAEYVFTGAI